MRWSTAVGVVLRSCSVEMGRIDEERPFSFQLYDLKQQGFIETGACENGTSEEVKNIVSVLNAGEVPSQDVVEVVVSPPYVVLPLAKGLLRPDFHIAAQNCWVKKGGAFTSEVSAEMLVNMGIPWVILGHSEMRALLNESNEFVGDKVAYAPFSRFEDYMATMGVDSVRTPRSVSRCPDYVSRSDPLRGADLAGPVSSERFGADFGVARPICTDGAHHR
ncbi:Triosephosphate isomerase, cytosolic [Camellia lanceoleosa]|uniref:Triosephosphate isomerase, cytosolic n=1 Tax=Camellia lanceoleosa TaxID=1840588 RepID=A0ACC0F167_9ERIC|nr:Triosephosphate isomerase, cytosolic [Camellia lanceoleosa]